MLEEQTKQAIKEWKKSGTIENFDSLPTLVKLELSDAGYEHGQVDFMKAFTDLHNIVKSAKRRCLALEAKLNK